MSIIALLIGYLVYYVVYVICYNIFGDAGFLFYLGTFLSHSVGAFIGALVTGKIEFKKNGTAMNFLIPLMFFLTIFGCIVGVIRFGWGKIWEYLVSLVGLFIALGFFNMYVDKSEKR